MVSSVCVFEDTSSVVVGTIPVSVGTSLCSSLTSVSVSGVSLTSVSVSVVV